MADADRLRPDARRRLRWPLRLTHAGMVAERLSRAFWPLWSLCLLLVGVVFLGLHETLAVEIVWALTLAFVCGLVWAIVHGVRHFHWPKRNEAVARLDATMPGRPIAALEDTQAIGAGDSASEAVWQAHHRRMRAQLSAAKPVEPDLKLARFDKFGLRYVALTIFAVALLFGSVLRVETLAGMAPGGGQTVQSGPSWEGWVEPPAYTGRPSLYLNDIAQGTLEVPLGTIINLRLYGEVGALTVAETVSMRTDEIDSAANTSQTFEVRQAGEIRIDGSGGAKWTVLVAPDLAPTIKPEGDISWEADGEMSQSFVATDDYGVESGRAVFALDLDRIDRRYGLALAPEARDEISVELPMPLSGDRTDFSETLIENFSKHPWSGLPVTMTLEASDSVGAVGRSATRDLDGLPGRRFFDPLAKALIEQRRDLLWNRDNAPRVAQVLRAIGHRPEDIFRSETDYLRLRFISRRLENSLGYDAEGLFRDEAAEALWSLALRIEEGDLSDALERLRRAQDRLSEAMENGATNEEIAQLMQELREAMQDYMRQLAEQNQQNGQDQAEMQDMQEMTAQDLQSLLDQLQQLMEEGRMDEAQALLDQLAQMMENMQVAQGQQGGAPSQGQQAMQGLQQTLRDQQDLSDDSFQDLQNQFNQGQPGQQGQQGQQQGQGEPGQEGQPGQGQQGQQPGGGQGLGQQLAERQDQLRETLRSQQEGLPGDTAQDALDRAGRAMENAEESLRNQDLAGAINDQSEAMDALRDGLQELGEEMAQQQGQGQGGPGGQQAGNGPNGQSPTDPLGRNSGNEGQLGTRDQMLQDEDIYRRARDLLDEIRRRSSEQERPDVELDYLKRLLDRF